MSAPQTYATIHNDCEVGLGPEHQWDRGYLVRLHSEVASGNPIPNPDISLGHLVYRYPLSRESNAEAVRQLCPISADPSGEHISLALTIEFAFR